MSDQPSVDKLKTGAARLIRQAALVDGEWIAAAGANVIEVVSAVFKKDDRAAAIRAIKDAGQLGLAKRA